MGTPDRPHTPSIDPTRTRSEGVHVWGDYHQDQLTIDGQKITFGRFISI